MRSKYLARLESKMKEFIDEDCLDFTTDHEFNGYFHDTLVFQMALAAAAVVDSAFEAQEFLRKQQGNI